MGTPRLKEVKALLEKLQSRCVKPGMGVPHWELSIGPHRTQQLFFQGTVPGHQHADKQKRTQSSGLSLVKLKDERNMGAPRFVTGGQIFQLAAFLALRSGRQPGACRA